VKIHVYAFLLLVLLLGWSCGCREHDDYMLPAEWNSFFKFRPGQWWVLEHDRTGFRDSIYVAVARTGWAKETGHQTCKRREDFYLEFGVRSDTARSLSRVFRGLKLYAYADFDYTRFMTAPCNLYGIYRYMKGKFYYHRGLSDQLEAINHESSLDRLTIVSDDRSITFSVSGRLQLAFKRNIGLVEASAEGYRFGGHSLIHAFRSLNGMDIPIGTDGICDTEEQDPGGGYRVHDGTYRLVARGG
jgi:hypothetical protein